MSDNTDTKSVSRTPSVSFAERPAVDQMASQPGLPDAPVTGVRPPPEPPPNPFDLSSILECLPASEHAAFSAQFLRDAARALPRQDDVFVGHASRLVIPQDRPPRPAPATRRPDLVEYSVPLDKARPRPPEYFPQGSIMDPAIMIRPASPVTPFEFPFDMPTDKHRSIGDESSSPFSPMDCVTRVVGLPRVYGLKGDEGSYVKVMRSALPMDAIDNPSLMDGGANICITGILSLLVDVENIPPLPISVATTSGSFSLDDCCTKKGLIPLTLADGSVYYQPCYYCKNATETIISPEAIVAASDTLVHWTQEGHRGNAPGSIRFSSDSGLYSITLHLEKRDGLYYCPTDVFTVDMAAAASDIPIIRRVAAPPTSVIPPRRTKRYVPVTMDNMTESEVWMLRLGSPGEQQLDLLPGNVTGIPPAFQYHPFRFIDWKEEARIQKQAAQRSAERTIECKRRFYMDFGFMRASTSNFSRPNKKDDRVVLSYDGFSSYLLIVDEASRFVWVFLTNTKEPPLDILDTFLSRFGHERGGSIRTDQGGELARSFALSDLVLRSHKYVLEPTGADSPSQNGSVEVYNNKLAVRARTLLYGSGLPAKYWSAALLHSVYLHNRLVHATTRKTPFEGMFGVKPDLGHLKLFGSRVCVKQTGKRRSKLDRHDFKGLFLGYTATDQNIVYLDLDSGTVKRSHHAQFDEAWYLQASRPPAAQLLYDLGVTDAVDTSPDVLPSDDDSVVSDFRLPGTVEPVKIPWPPCAPGPPLDGKMWPVPDRCTLLPLPLQHMPSIVPTRRSVGAKAALVQTISPPPRKVRRQRARDIMRDVDVNREDMAMVYMSPDIHTLTLLRKSLR